jgi:hypothetical protein
MEKMKGVMPQKNSPELVAGNKDVVEAARKMRKSGGSAQTSSSADMTKYANMIGQKRKSGGKAMKAKKEMGKMAGKMAAMRADRKPRKSGGMCSSDWSAAQGEGQKPRG